MLKIFIKLFGLKNIIMSIILDIVGITFVILKLTDVVSWNWFIVIFPFLFDIFMVLNRKFTTKKPIDYEEDNED